MDLLLVGVDGTDGAQHALRWAAELATAVDARILAVHVMPSSLEWELAVMQVDSEVVAKDRKEKLVGTWTTCLRSAGAQYSTRFLRGDPAKVLLEVAEKEAVDLIVVGTKRHSTVHDALLGGTAHTLANRAKCPVTLVPRPRSEREAG